MLQPVVLNLQTHRALHPDLFANRRKESQTPSDRLRYKRYSKTACESLVFTCRCSTGAGGTAPLSAKTEIMRIKEGEIGQSHKQTARSQTSSNEVMVTKFSAVQRALQSNHMCPVALSNFGTELPAFRASSRACPYPAIVWQRHNNSQAMSLYHNAIGGGIVFGHCP